VSFQKAIIIDVSAHSQCLAASKTQGKEVNMLPIVGECFVAAKILKCHLTDHALEVFITVHSLFVTSIICAASNSSFQYASIWSSVAGCNVWRAVQ
jgi:hypothetical protein